MSWFGVSLNDIKGQLTSFTNEVLSEGLADVDDGTQVIVSRERINELDSLCQLQKHELEEGKRARDELEERLQAANLHSAHQIATLRQQLQQRETELRELREKSVEWGWGVGEKEVEEGKTGPPRPHKQQQQQEPGDKQVTWQENHNQQLSRRVEELEGELVRLREAHQEEVSALQDHHRQHLLSLTPRPGEPGLDARDDDGGDGGDDGGCPEPSTPSTTHTQSAEDAASGARQDVFAQRCEALEREKGELQASLSTLQAQLEHLTQKAEAAAELETKLSSLNDRCAALQEENEQYDKNQEMLDTQYQQAVEQILKKKNQLQEEAQAMRAAHQETLEALSRAHQEQNQVQEEMKHLQAELATVRHSEEASQSTVKHQLESFNKEISELKMIIDEKSTSILKLEEKSQVMSQEKLEKSKYEEELQVLREQEQLQRSQLEEKNLLLQDLSGIQNKYEEEKKSNVDLETSLESIRSELDKLRISERDFEESYKHSEEKRQSAEAEVKNLEQQVTSLTQQVSTLRHSLDQTQALQKSSQEEENHRDLLQEKISMIESANSLLDQELQKRRKSLEDTQARTEILDSELQAKAQELTMSNTRIEELEARLKQAESDLTDVDRLKTDEMEELKKALAHHNQEAPKSVKAGVHRLVELLRDSVWQRDTLERHVSSLTQELREKNDLLGEAELSRAELERECEDLRDQLEEVQKGVRPQPEGSSRGLPTIEEEVEGGAEGEAEEDQLKEGCRAKEFEQREPPEQERSHEIEALQAQVEALSEARRNLETEVASVRADREQLQGQLRQVEGRTGNLANLETEAAALRNENKNLEMQLESLTQELDLTTVTLQDERDTLKEQLSILEEQHQSLQVEMNILNHERNSIGQQLLAQYKGMEERDATIRILESEVDGLKDTLRENFGTTCDQRKALETSLREEINSVKSQLIYKEDKVDAFSQALQQIGQIFQIEDGTTNIDKTCKLIQDKYSALQQTTKEKEERVDELAKTVTNLQGELEACKKIDIESESQSSSVLSEKYKDLILAREQLERSEMEVVHLRGEVEEKNCLLLDMENNVKIMKGELETQKHEKDENTIQLDQKNRELLDLKEEFSKVRETLEKENGLVSELRKDLEESRTKIISEEKTVQNLSQEISVRDHQLVERESKVTALLSQINDLEKNISEMKVQESERVSLSLDTENMIKQKHALKEQNAQLLEEKNALLQEKEKLRIEKEELHSGREAALQELGTLRGERDQMIATVTHKHQESLSYHAEIQRLSQVLSQSNQQHSDEKATLSAQLRESEAVLAETRSLVASLKEELHSLKIVQSELQKNAAEGIVQKTELSGLRKETDTLRAKFSSVEQERDQLRMANAHFNTQYQDQSKELSIIKERESRMSNECERLRQHLVAVEESYTAEALKSEEREATLRSTLAKMEEKLNNHSSFYNSASQRASDQVGALQEQLQEMSAKRDDAVLRLHAAEEAAEQHQHSLTTLQQVLQDFQKNQAREIAEATERTRRRMEEEQEKNTALTTQLNGLKSQLAEVQGGLAAASRLGEQLAKKEQMIVALKAQVSSQEEVARRARDEVSCLKNSSEGKVDKPLLRNLLVGYFATPMDKRQEVLRVIAEVLDFSGEERTRTGLDTQGTSWLSSIANFLAPPASNVRVTSKVDVLDHTSLSQAFIRFLEDESSPRPQPRLPAVQMAQQTTEKAEKKAQAKAQAANKINPFISSGDTQVPCGDRDSQNSSPLLAAASTPPTLPSIAPLKHSTPSALVTPTPITPGPGDSGLGGANSVSTNKYLTNLLTPEAGKSDENGNKHLS